VVKKIPTKTSSEAVCEHCRGAGYIVTPEGASPCQCRRAEDLARAYQLSRIPRKFLSKTLAAFQTRSPQHKHIVHDARAFLKTFKGNAAENASKGMLLSGKEGTGKTHLAVAILKEVIEKGYSGLYWNVPELFLELRRRMEDKSEEHESELFDHANRVDLLVLDDLGAERTSDYVLDRLYVLINGRYQNDTATIITTNRTIPELRQQIGPRITSRIGEMCVLLEFPAGDFRLQNLK
jgi:DNA replication protein DnaC